MRAESMIPAVEALDKSGQTVIVVGDMSSHKRCGAEGCNRFIPDERRFDALYCSKKCAWRVQSRRYREKKPKE